MIKTSFLSLKTDSSLKTKEMYHYLPSSTYYMRVLRSEINGNIHSSFSRISSCRLIGNKHLYSELRTSRRHIRRFSSVLRNFIRVK